MIGKTLGAYDVVAKLGEGGMGEVYRAHDTKLKRDVALKIVPAAFSADADRFARFTREAQTLAALNHPNIAQVHGLEESSGVRALVMELVDGEDLSAHIARGPMPIAEALPIARQIADALEAAHEHGIVHRDLKPANIKIRADGTVKVLDFGLAKAHVAPGTAHAAPSTSTEHGAPSTEHEHASQLPTMTSPALTEMGVILGTAAYMAPEQAKGKPVDRRADIWAFGVLLYEMLSGRRLFHADTVSETLAAVLREEIDLTLLPVDVPADVKRLIARCLDRDPRTRLRDIGEARVLLSSPVSASVESGRLPAAASVGRVRLAWAAAGMIVGAGALVMVQWTAGASGSDEETGGGVPVYSLQRLTDLPGPETQPDISPDGRQVLYTSGVGGNADVYLLRVGGARAINLTAGSTADDEQARFSPNGEQIVFRSSRDGGGLFLMGATGESARRLTTAGYDPAWSPDGRTVAYSTEGVVDPYARSLLAELWTADVTSGSATRLHAGDAVQPAWSPDGTRIAFWANTGGQRDIWTMPAGGGTPEAVTEDAATDWSPAWSPDGRWLYFESDRGGSMNVWRVRIDQATGRREGVPQPVTNGVRALGYARLSADGGRMVVMGYDGTHDITVLDFDPAAPDRLRPRTTMRGQTFTWCDPSPDGTWLACTSRGAHEDLILVRSDGTETRRLMDDEFKDRGPTWAPDGKTIGFYSTRSGTWEAWAIQADGSNLRQLTSLDKDTSGVTWSPDGARAILAAVSTRTVWRIDPSRLNAIDTAEALTGLAEAAFLDVQDWSPSGSLLAGNLYTNPQNMLEGSPAVWNLSSGTVRTLNVPPTSAGAIMSFLPDSRRLLVGAPRGLLLVDLAGGEPRLLRQGAPTDGHGLSRDGRTLVIDQSAFDSDIWLMELGTTRAK